MRPHRHPLLCLGMLAAAGCGLPFDPRDTLERVHEGTLRVGAVESPPYLTRSGGAASGPEADLVLAIARAFGARVEWRWASHDHHLEALARFDLDLVAAGLTVDSPWNGRVGLTRAWHHEPGRDLVLAVPPGENAFLVAVERVILSRHAAASSR